MSDLPSKTLLEPVLRWSMEIFTDMPSHINIFTDAGSHKTNIWGKLGVFRPSACNKWASCYTVSNTGAEEFSGNDVLVMFCFKISISMNGKL